jgi:hypothetical protein
MSRTCAWVAAALALNLSSARAVTCEEFAARFAEGAAQSKIPAPKFDLAHVNSADPDWRDFSITTVSDVRSMLSCRHGEIDAYAVDANGPGRTSTDHVGALTAIGIYSDGWTWQEATAIRDQLLRKAKETSVAEQTSEGAKFSLIISVAGVASFQIDDSR